MIYQPSFTITPAIAHLLADTAEAIGRLSVQQELSLHLLTMFQDAVKAPGQILQLLAKNPTLTLASGDCIKQICERCRAGNGQTGQRGSIEICRAEKRRALGGAGS